LEGRDHAGEDEVEKTKGNVLNAGGRSRRESVGTIRLERREGGGCDGCSCGRRMGISPVSVLTRNGAGISTSFKKGQIRDQEGATRKASGLRDGLTERGGSTGEGRRKEKARPFYKRMSIK